MFLSQHAREAEPLGSLLSLNGTRLTPGGVPIPHQLTQLLSPWASQLLPHRGAGDQVGRSLEKERWTHPSPSLSGHRAEFEYPSAGEGMGNNYLPVFCTSEDHVSLDVWQKFSSSLFL